MADIMFFYFQLVWAVFLTILWTSISSAFQTFPAKIFAAAVGFLGIYILLPIIYYFSPRIQRFLIFQNNVKRPKGVNFADPEAEGINGARNIYLKMDDDSSIGVWHILPRSLTHTVPRNASNEIWNEVLKSSGKSVIIYFHGNTGSRALGHRKELYIVLQNIDCHIISFDYRGYADSTAILPSQTTVFADGVFIYRWVRHILADATLPVFIWGHSLGSGIASHIVDFLCSNEERPTGLILESSFTSLGECIRHHYIAAPYSLLPAFDWIFVEPLRKNDIGFDTDRHIRNIDIPIAIMHSEDDHIVPFRLGKRLYGIGIDSRPLNAKSIRFKRFNSGLGCAHKFICRAPELPDFISQFLLNCIQDNLDTESEFLP